MTGYSLNHLSRRAGAILAVLAVFLALWGMPDLVGATPVAFLQETGVENPVTTGPIDINAQVAMWLAVLGFFSNFAISFVNRAIPGVEPEDRMKRGAVAFLFCVVVGVLDTMVRGTFNLVNATASILLIFSTAIGFYNTWFKTSGFPQAIEGPKTG